MENLYHTCDIWRNAAVGTNGRRSFAVKYTSVACLFLPISKQSAVFNNVDVGRSFEVFFDDGTDVLVGDKLIFNSVSYIVKGVRAFTGLPSVSHIEVLAETEHANGQ